MLFKLKILSNNFFVNVFGVVFGKCPEKHRYHVYIAENSDTDLVHGIVICYDKDDDGQTTAQSLADKEVKKTEETE